LESLRGELTGIKQAKNELNYENAPSLFLILFKIHYKRVIAGLLLRLIGDILIACGPVLVNLLLQYIDNKGSAFQPGLLIYGLRDEDFVSL
jgi:hypothetical protein